MWSESSSVSIVNLEKKITTVTEISNFPRGLLFGAPYRFRKRARYPVSRRNNSSKDCPATGVFIVKVPPHQRSLRSLISYT